MSESLTFSLPKFAQKIKFGPDRSRLAREIAVFSKETACLPYVQLRMMYLLTNKCYLAL